MLWNDLSRAAEKADFTAATSQSLWIEGIDGGSVERGVTITLKVKDAGGTEILTDTCKATIVMINLANASYRDNVLTGFRARGHAAIITGFDGQCTAADLNDDSKFEIINMGVELTQGPDVARLTEQTQKTGCTVYGCYTNLAITHIQRLQVIKMARHLVENKVWYTVPFPTDALEVKGEAGNSWDGKLNSISALRCDGVVEVCYELNNVPVWGMHHSGQTTPIYLIQNALTDHNDFDSVGWADTLQPATQCGYVTPVNADTKFTKQHLCEPVGSKGGN